jgi:hypothetical protein
MIGFLERGFQLLSYEISRTVDEQGYELVIKRPDGSERVEQFVDPTMLIERMRQLERLLLGTGWHGPDIPPGKAHPVVMVEPSFGF